VKKAKGTETKTCGVKNLHREIATGKLEKSQNKEGGNCSQKNVIEDKP